MKIKYVVVNTETNAKNYFASMEEVMAFLKGKRKNKYKVKKIAG